MEKKELENLLMRFSHLGVTHSKNGALLIGKAPHIAEYAWLNVMYPCVTETEVCDLEKRLGVAIPKVYKDFLMNVSNGFDIMNCTLALHGCRTSYDRSDLDSWYPFNLEDVQKYERPKNATPEMFFLGTYEYDGSKLNLNTLDDKIYYCDRYDATPLKSWDSLSAMLTSEIERIFGLFDADGRIFSRMAPTTPVAL
jgi:hypothetical protein